MGSNDADFQYDEDVAAALIRGIGAFVRVAQIRKLPPALRRLRTLRPQTMARHRAELLSSLDDEDLRAAIVEWLEEGHVPLRKSDAELLRVAAGRERGWEQKLAPSGAPIETAVSGTKQLEARITRVEDQLARERDKVRDARAEARRAKEEARRDGEARRDLAEELRSEKSSLAAARNQLKQATSEIEQVRTVAERETRRLTRAAERSAARADNSAKQLREARRELGRAQKSVNEYEAATMRLKGRITSLEVRIEGLEADVERLTGELEGIRGTRLPNGAARKVPKARSGRAPLPVPKGRMAEDPQTLEEWLGTPAVQLVVDGYNVTKAEGGYGEVSLERQRERLIDEISALTARKGVHTVIVFDGSEVPPGRRRRLRRGLLVEYSAPGETADDYIVRLLEAGDHEGSAPAIVVTNDRGLQDRAAARGATIATSNQLLALIR